ncbi:MAG: FecR domain-containing protein, partial [Desulfobaccales bacterium]
MKTFVAVLTSILLVCVGLVALAQAEVVGRVTQVEGTVDFLKGGKLPASPAKLDDSVEVGDVMRTKSLSKAQITFMDNTVITISPESRIAIEEYMIDPKGKRNAVLQLFQGLAHVVVSKLFKASEPDFVVKTQTAVMGVRGTEVGLRIHPNNTTILNFEGHTEVGNIFPEVGDLLFKKAFKIAFSWGHSTVHLHNMQGTSVFRGLPPTQPFTITKQDQQQFMGQMGSGLTSRKDTKAGTQTAGGGGGTGTSGSGSSSVTSAALGGSDSGLGSTGLSTLPTSITTPTTSGIAGTGLTPNQVLSNTIISPTNNPTETTPVTPPPTPPPTPNFSETLSGPYALTSTSPYTVGNFASTSPATGTRTGVNPGPVTANYNFSAIWSTGATTWNPSYNGTFTATISGSTIAGTLNVTLLDSPGGSFSGSAVPFTVDPAGNLTFSLASLTGLSPAVSGLP